jgi:Zn-dependent peptidase ImmA (M78 family)/transcriptional regulator with XRE-family HTH domain
MWQTKRPHDNDDPHPVESKSKSLHFSFRKIILRGMNDLIAIRLKALREQRKLSQDQLAAMFGFKDRQTVSAIETGERRISAEELLTAVQKLGIPLEYFTDPFMLVGEGEFSWRQSGTPPKNLADFELSAGRAIAAYRKLAEEVGKRPEILRRELRLTGHSTFEQAMAAGERFADDYDLGDVPADRLAQAMEEKLGILVLMVDAIKGISGAACRVRDLDAVLINRNEVIGRRNFDLAHELFHILTWEAMPPAHVEDASEGGAGPRRTGKKSRVEQLADNFAGAVLMPRKVLEGFGPWRNDLAKRLNKVAVELRVTATALKWRLVAAGLLDRVTADTVSDAELRNNGRAAGKSKPPPMFSKTFMAVISAALLKGVVSMRRGAELLDVAVDDIPDLCTAHGLEAPDEL